MKNVTTTWDEADIDELTAIVKISNPLFRNFNSERIKSHLISINERFPSDYLIQTRDDKNLLAGWLCFEKITETMGYIGRWQPHILDIFDKENVFKQLLNELTNLAISQGINRIEAEYGDVSEDNMSDYLQRSQWLEDEGFHKLEDNLFLECNISKLDLTNHSLPKDIQTQVMSKINTDNLFKCYKESFSTSEHRQFFDYSEQQIREAFDNLFDLTKPFNNRASIVLTKNGQVIGFSLVRPRTGEEHLAIFGIHPDYRRMGLAKTLLLKSMSIVLNQGTERMTIGVDAVNVNAVKLYEKVGFILVSKMIVHSWKKAE